MAQRLDFIDISHWQSDAGAINWTQVSKNVPAVIIKATQGTSYVDPDYAENRRGAEELGLKVATYHFLEHGNIAKQMQHYLKTVAPVDGERMVIDYEHEDCVAQDLVAAVEYLLSNSSVEVTVYGASKLTDDVRGYKGDLSILSGTSLWAARYSSSEPEIAEEVWPVWTAWQYSQTGKVKGITGDVDCNMFNGTEENMLAWFGPAGEPEPVLEKNVLVRVTVDPGVKVTVTVNGEPWRALKGESGDYDLD